jgi:hypothetical protein
MMKFVIYDTVTGRIYSWTDQEPNGDSLVAGEAFIETPVTYVQGKYYKVDVNSKTVFEIVYAAPEVDWSETRQIRNAMLTSTDYVLTPDYPIEPELLEKVKAFRTELRNITETYKTPSEVVWPVNPLRIKG